MKSKHREAEKRAHKQRNATTKNTINHTNKFERIILLAHTICNRRPYCTALGQLAYIASQSITTTFDVVLRFWATCKRKNECEWHREAERAHHLPLLLFFKSGICTHPRRFLSWFTSIWVWKIPLYWSAWGPKHVWVDPPGVVRDANVTQAGSVE